MTTDPISGAQARPSRPIYIAIMAAAELRVGVHLSADEVRELSLDDAIVSRAAVCLPDDNDHTTETGFSWTTALRDWSRRKISDG